MPEENAMLTFGRRQIHFWLQVMYSDSNFIEKFVSDCTTDTHSALGQVMACRMFGDKTLPETMMILVSDAY